MPKWGITDEQRETRPWGLEPGLLAPAKVVTDPVHGDVFVNVLEAKLLDSPPMQRLRRVRQLGTTHLVYPAATHSRFSHSLGALRAAQDLLDAVAGNRTAPRHTPDLLDEWDNSGRLPDGTPVLEARFAEATVLARLGALLHDFCHVPLGHTIEDDLKVLLVHDGNKPRFERLWNRVEESTRRPIERGASRFTDATLSLLDELLLLILSKLKRNGLVSSYPFVGDIVGNTICADLIDYLRRDHWFTGLPIALGHRFVNDFYVMDSHHKHFPKRMVVRIARDGHLRADVVTELVKYLRYRYELTERVLTHHAKVAADAMISKLLEMWSDSIWNTAAASDFPEVVARVGRDDIDALKDTISEDASSRGLDPATVLDGIQATVGDLLEATFTERSDDGLLEHVVDEARRLPADRRSRGIESLATAVLSRDLFKLIGRAESRADMALAQEKFEKFGRADARRQLERNAARLAGLEHGWQVVIWLPNPDMKLKVAGVLVDNDDGVAPLDRIEDASGQIVEQHRELWAISVYAHPSVRDAADTRTADVLLSSVRTDMDVRLVRWDGEPVPATHELAANVIAEHEHLDANARSLLLRLVPAASGGTPTFSDLLVRLWRAAEANGLLSGNVPDDL
jgi:HD superfamily phosphohydrolase